ncbi:hypothetical protein Tco_0278094 [Tanacetum coccineum]
MASLVEQLAQHIDQEIARDLKVCKILLEILQELYVNITTRKKLIDEFKEKVGLMVDMSSIRFLDEIQYQEMNMHVDTLKHVNEVHACLLERSNFMIIPPGMNGVSLGVRFDGCFMHVPLRILLDSLKLCTIKFLMSSKRRDVANAYVDELVNWAENEVEYDEESMQTEEAAVQTKQIEIGLTYQVKRVTRDEAVQGEDNQQQQQDNPVEHENP